MVENLIMKHIKDKGWLKIDECWLSTAYIFLSEKYCSNYFDHEDAKNQWIWFSLSYL